MEFHYINTITDCLY